MTVVKKQNPGKFCWTDLGTPDVTGAKKFYRGVFGWTVKDLDMGMGDAKYSIFRVRGKDVCALYPLFYEQGKKKVKPAWLPYIAVKSVDDTVKKAKAAGGKISSEPMDVMDQGRLAIIADPTGADFGLWQARKHRGEEIEHVPGAICWHDLNTLKPKVAGKFYPKVFGWKLSGEDIGGHEYYLFTRGKANACGMWPFPMKKLPPSWLTYFQVSNCAKTVAKAKRLGGRVLMGTTVVPGPDHRFAVLTDPQGAAFGIFEFKN